MRTQVRPSQAVVLVACALGLASGQAQAQATRGLTPDQMQDFNRTIVKVEALEDVLETSGLKGLKISGYMDPTYIYNVNANRAGFQFLSTQGEDDSEYDYSDTPFFGTAALDFTKEADDGTIYKLTLAGNAAGVGLDEASISIPLNNRQNRLIAGLVPDWSGYEYADPVQTTLITHNLLFDYTLPVAYTGAGVDMSTGRWQFRTMLANVDSPKAVEDEFTPAWVMRFDYWPEEFWGVGFASLVGRTMNWNTEEPSDTVLLEVDGYFERGDWSLGGQISYGTQKEAAVDGSDATWYGVSGTVAYKITPRLQFALRGDFLASPDGGGGAFGYTGFDPDTADYANGIGSEDGEDGANRYAVSAGFKYIYNPNTAFKYEVRLDGADQDVFYNVKDEDVTNSNLVIGAAVVVSF